MSINTRIAKAYVVLIIASVMGHILSMGKEIIVANYFGITKMMDAFYTALVIPNQINAALMSPFLNIFLPIFIKYKMENKDEANLISSVLINYLFLFFSVATVIIFIFAPQIVKLCFSGLDPETYLLSVKILKIISVTIIFAGLVGLLSNLLNAYEHFVTPAYSQMFVTISVMVFILCFAKKWGIFVFAWGLLAGLFIQVLFLLPVTLRKGYRHYFSLQLKHPAIKKTLKLSLVYLLIATLAGLNPIINRAMASWLPSGSIAALAYADKLVQVPLIIFSGSIATAIYPFFSIQFAENKIEEMKDTIATSIKMTGFIFIPLAITMIILAKPTIQVLYQEAHSTKERPCLPRKYSYATLYSYSPLLQW